jgi:pyruvyl transferase EpsO
VWTKHSKDIVFKSINYFDSKDLVVTDRLHGLILSSLLGKNIVLRDNSYGKNSRYKVSWLNDYPYFTELLDE